MDFIYTVRHEDGQEICKSPGLNPHEAYDAFVRRFFGNGNCGFVVEVVCPDGNIVEF